MLIVGGRDDLRAVVRRSAVQPRPILYDADRNNPILITRPGGPRAVSRLD